MPLGQSMPLEPNEPYLIAADAVARLLDVSVRSLWRMRSAGQLPQPVRLGGAVRWRLDEIRRWIAEGCPSKASQR